MFLDHGVSQQQVIRPRKLTRGTGIGHDGQGTFQAVNSPDRLQAILVQRKAEGIEASRQELRKVEQASVVLAAS